MLLLYQGPRISCLSKWLCDATKLGQLRHIASGGLQQEATIMDFILKLWNLLHNYLHWICNDRGWETPNHRTRPSILFILPVHRFWYIYYFTTIYTNTISMHTLQNNVLDYRFKTYLWLAHSNLNGKSYYNI